MIKRAILPVLLLTSLALAVEDSPRTIVTSDGTTYAQAVVTELRPTGVTVTTESGIAFIPYSQLPKDLYSRYVPNPTELARAIGASVDGTYETPPENTGFGGERIVLKEGIFVYEGASDTLSTGRVRGRFTRNGHWITFHHKEFAFPNRVLTILNGKLSLLALEDFKAWRESNDLHRIAYGILQRTSRK